MHINWAKLKTVLNSLSIYKIVGIGLFLILNRNLSAQIIDLDSIPKTNLSSYDIVLIGETHFIQSTENVETKLISFFKDSSPIICLEAPVDMNIGFEYVFFKKDTLKYNFHSFTQNGYKSNLLQSLYKSNLRVQATNILRKEYFIKDEILKIYSQKAVPLDIFKEMENFSNIGYLVPPSKYKNMVKYYKFLEVFEKNKTSHAKYLGTDSTKVFLYFEGLKAMLNSENDYGKDGPLMTNYREEFMFNVIKKEIDNKENQKVISINGNEHINLDNKSKWIRDKNFISLGARIKLAYSEKKIASIYLMYREKDLYFKKSYPNEYKFIIQHTQPGQEYIIEINEKNTQFKNFVGKYTHIVVY